MQIILPFFLEESCDENVSSLSTKEKRKFSKSAIELRKYINKTDSSSTGRSPEHGNFCKRTESNFISRVRHPERYLSVSQRTQTFFMNLKSRLAQARSKGRKKDGFGMSLTNPGNNESDYAADYSSEHSRSSSATQSPARHYLNNSGKFFETLIPNR